MTDRTGTDGAPLRVWRRSTEKPVAAAEQPRVYGGGPDRTVEEIYQTVRARKQALDEERQREKAKAAEAKKKKKPKDEDDTAAIERFRNDRYAVGLLRQDDNAWGAGPDHSGTLG